MAVDTVGQAGKPKTITGFQTHSAPPAPTPSIAQGGPPASALRDACLCLRDAAAAAAAAAATPVLLAHGERAELADESNGEYLAVTSLLEGIVIVKPNPYEPASPPPPPTALSTPGGRRSCVAISVQPLR
jgi:26S proteasome regulatory subunit N1